MRLVVELIGIPESPGLAYPDRREDPGSAMNIRRILIDTYQGTASYLNPIQGYTPQNHAERTPDVFRRCNCSPDTMLSFRCIDPCRGQGGGHQSEGHSQDNLYKTFPGDQQGKQDEDEYKADPVGPPDEDSATQPCEQYPEWMNIPDMPQQAATPPLRIVFPMDDRTQYRRRYRQCSRYYDTGAPVISPSVGDKSPDKLFH